MAWLTGWSYRKEITITGETGAGTDYQVLFDIGDASGGDFHLEGNCTNFPEDIEVTDNDGETLLKFYIPDKTADPLEMWVKVADDLGSNQTIYIYYGKSGATTNSDIENTFLFGDDFPGSSIDTGKWTVTGTVGVGSSEATLNEDDKILSIATFGFETAVVAKSKADEQDSSFVGYTTDANNRFEVVNSDSGSNDDFDNIMVAAVKAGSFAGWILNNGWNDFRNTYYQYELKRISTSLMAYRQGANSNTYTNSTYIPTGDMSVGVYVWDSSQASSVICDWIFVRKCIATEPAFSSAGSEEAAISHATTLLHGKIRIKDSSTNLADGKVQVQDVTTSLVDGQVKVLDTAFLHADGLLAVQDKATGLIDGKVQIQDTVTNLVDGKVIVSLISTDTDQADGKIQIKDVTTTLVDGLIQIKDTVVGVADGKLKIRDIGTNLADGKIQIKDVTTGIVDGLIKVKESVTNLADGKVKINNIGSNLADGLIQIKDKVTNLVDGKIIINEGETSTSLFNGLLRIKDAVTGIADGLLRIIEKPINLADGKVILVDDFNGPFTATITDTQEYTAVITSTQEYTATITDTQEYTAGIS